MLWTRSTSTFAEVIGTSLVPIAASAVMPIPWMPLNVSPRRGAGQWIVIAPARKSLPATNPHTRPVSAQTRTNRFRTYRRKPHRTDIPGWYRCATGNSPSAPRA
jgi:hypothetical protein